MILLHFIFGIIQKVERYLAAKSTIERMIVFTISGLCVGVLLWRFIVPVLEDYTRYFQRLSDLRQINLQNEREEESHLQHFKNKQIALKILTDQIYENYTEIEQTQQIWQDILGEVSKTIMDTNMIPEEIRIHEQNMLILKGRAEWWSLLELMNLLEYKIRLLQVESIEYAQNSEGLNYELKIRNPIKISENVEKTEQVILNFLEFSSEPHHPIAKIEFPKNSPIVSQTIDLSPITIQAFMSHHAKINGEWFTIGEIKQGIRLIGIDDCGVIIERAQEKSCINIGISGEQK